MIAEPCAVHSMFEATVEKHDARLGALEETTGAHSVEIGRMGVKFEEVERMLTSMETTQVKILDAIDKLRFEPARKWQALVGIVIGVVASGVVGWIIGQVLK